jgi:preprotein translocase subunit SecG
MTTIQKLITGLIAVALVTTAVLPKRGTSSVIGAAGSAGSSLFSTVMGTSVPKGAMATGQ